MKAIEEYQWNLCPNSFSKCSISPQEIPHWGNLVAVLTLREGGNTSAKSDFLGTTWESGRLLFPGD